jgi:hypothetical protein
MRVAGLKGIIKPAAVAATHMGQIVKVKGILAGEKSENGWKFHVSERQIISN